VRDVLSQNKDDGIYAKGVGLAYSVGWQLMFCRAEKFKKFSHWALQKNSAEK
jgi:hypothetical protein